VAVGGPIQRRDLLQRRRLQNHRSFHFGGLHLPLMLLRCQPPLAQHPTKQPDDREQRDIQDDEIAFQNSVVAFFSGTSLRATMPVTVKRTGTTLVLGFPDAKRISSVAI